MKPTSFTSQLNMLNTRIALLLWLVNGGLNSTATSGISTGFEPLTRPDTDLHLHLASACLEVLNKRSGNECKHGAALILSPATILPSGVQECKR